MRRLLTVVVSFVFFVVPSISAQDVGQLPPLTAQVEVHVVNVDVTVTDRHGSPVLDLTKGDFEVLEDGHPQKVTNFSVIQNPTAGASKAPQPGAQPSSGVRRLIMLIIDNNYIGEIERNRALDTVAKHIDDSTGAEWAVTAISHASEVLQPFTSDKALIRSALAKVRAMPSSEGQHAIDRAVLSEKYITTGDVTVPVDYKEKVGFSSREQTFRSLMAIQNTARAVVDTARAYAGEDGKKTIVLLTGGMESNTSFTAYEKSDDFELKQLRDQISQISDAMVREANGANFTVNVINARPRRMAAPQHDVQNHSSGIAVGALLRNFGNDPIDVADVDTIPLSIALGTGGMYLPSSDLRDSLQRIDTQTSNFYSLGYSPDHNGDQQYHTISVRVKRPGVRVANRVGYYDETQEDRLEAVLRARTSFDTGLGSLPVKVKVGDAARSERDLVVSVTTAMPLARITVVPREQNFVGRVHVYCSVFDDKGRNVGFLHKTQEVSLAPPQLSGTGDFLYTMKVHLQKGAFTIVITLRDELSNEIGSASQSVSL
ncbi:MAG TPA: VWA domain-containing protein [Thermoanaerobaculia bacterium]|jgi:VWFA-related protein|nr:VWA domain-containing protein [Thermoanaerobaculia bacterium]